MPRPYRLRRISGKPNILGLKPLGIPLDQLEVIALGPDEAEALRLADQEGLYQEQAAEQMGISRVTFGRILQKAHAKMAEALLENKAVVLGEGPVRFSPRADGACPVHGGPRRRGRACRCELPNDVEAKGGST